MAVPKQIADKKELQEEQADRIKREKEINAFFEQNEFITKHQATTQVWPELDDVEKEYERISRLVDTSVSLPSMHEIGGGGVPTQLVLNEGQISGGMQTKKRTKPLKEIQIEQAEIERIKEQQARRKAALHKSLNNPHDDDNDEKQVSSS